MGTPKGDEKKKISRKNIWLHNDWNLPKLITDAKAQIHEAHSKQLG